MAIKRPPRLAGFDYVGKYRYFLTICTEDKLQAFADLEPARSVLAQFLRHAETAGFAVIAYCLMPDHLHALVEGTRADADLRTFVHRWKQKTGFDWKQRTRERLWQEGYYDRVLRPEESDLFYVAYIAGNPVFGGLAVEPEEYPLFESRRYALDDVKRALAEIGAGVPWQGSPAGRRNRVAD